MSSITLDKTLAEKVDKLEEKSERIEQSKNTEAKVDEATDQIERVCRRLDDVESKAEELQFYVRLYKGAFGDDGTQPGGIRPHVRNALQRVEIDDEELLEAARDGRLRQLEDQVGTAEEQIGNATDVMTDLLKDARDDWKNDLESAKELNEVIGGDSGFRSLIVEMERFLTSGMWNTNKKASTLVAQWERYERRWKKNAGKHGWETFQEEHGLDDSTIDELRQFTDDDPVRLSDLSLSTLEEIKRVPDLESALQLEVRS